MDSRPWSNRTSYDGIECRRTSYNGIECRRSRLRSIESLIIKTFVDTPAFFLYFIDAIVFKEARSDSDQYDSLWRWNFVPDKVRSSAKLLDRTSQVEGLLQKSILQRRHVRVFSKTQMPAVLRHFMPRCYEVRRHRMPWYEVRSSVM
jgi:hypothetical protein